MRTTQIETEKFELTNKDLRRINMEIDSHFSREDRDIQARMQRRERVLYKRARMNMQMADSSRRH